MSFKIFVFAVAVFAAQANAQVGGFIRPFINGYANGISEFAKPFVQLGQAVLSPATDYFSPARPQIGQWMVYPNQKPLISQAEGAAYEGYDTVANAIPGSASFVQVMRPRPFRPQISMPQGNVFVPSRPYPIPVPAPAPAPAPSSSSEESDETFVPSNLLPQTQPQPQAPELAVEIPTGGDVPMTLEAKDVPLLQRPLPFVEDEQ